MVWNTAAHRELLVIVFLAKSSFVFLFFNTKQHNTMSVSSQQKVKFKTLSNKHTKDFVH